MNASVAALLSLLGLLAGQTDPGAPRKSLLIVTTDRIREGSAVLQTFAAQKEKRGFTVTIASERDFGGAGVVGPEKAALLRDWLKSVHPQYSFLLLIGGAHPDYGEIPMWRVWPRSSYPPDLCGGFALDCRSHATDYPYADLSGNWDLDADGLLGETGDDEGPGGLDLDAELLVGRIPFFFDELDELDRALQHAIDYMNQKPEEAAAYRSKVLLASAFFYFRGQQLIGATSPEDVDGADIGEWLRRDLLERHPELTITTLTEQEGVVKSRWPADVPLSEDNLVAEWAKGQGLVFWNAHGLEREIGRTVWTADTNGDGRAGPGELASPRLFRSADAALLDPTRPAFLVPVSCEVGSADVPDNLAYRLLVEGGAVGLIGSSSVTPASRTDYSSPDNELDTASLGADNLGARFFQRLLEGDYPGRAFYETKRDWGSAGHVESLAGRTMINYFGDPSLTLQATSADLPPLPRPKVSKSTWEPDGRAGCSAAGGGAAAAPWASLLLATGVLSALSVPRRRRRCDVRPAPVADAPGPATERPPGAGG